MKMAETEEAKIKRAVDLWFEHKVNLADHEYELLQKLVGTNGGKKKNE